MPRSATGSGYRFIPVIAVLLLAGVVYTIFDPAETAWMPKCPVYVISGYSCPGCGTQRALHSLLNGDITGAFRANALLFLFIPLIVVLTIGEINRRKWPKFYSRLLHPIFIYGILGVVVGWTIVRNIIY